MDVEIRIDSSCTEPRVIILTDCVTEEVNAIVRKLSQAVPEMIAGFKDDCLQIISPEDIIRIYSAAGKVIAVTDNEEYTLRRRLYEMEERLNGSRFIRISNSEIINLKKARSFDLSIAGTICVRLSNGETSYVSRRYVSKIKQMLGV